MRKFATIGEGEQFLSEVTARGIVDIDNEKSDANELSSPVRAILIEAGGGGAIKFMDFMEQTWTINFEPGYHMIGMLKVFDTDTTATLIWGLI